MYRSCPKHAEVTKKSNADNERAPARCESFTRFIPMIDWKKFTLLDIIRFYFLFLRYCSTDVWAAFPCAPQEKGREFEDLLEVAQEPGLTTLPFPSYAVTITLSKVSTTVMVEYFI